MDNTQQKRITLSELFNQAVRRHCGRRVNLTMATYGMLIGVYDLAETELGKDPNKATKLMNVLNKQFQNSSMILTTQESYIHEICDVTHAIIKDLSPIVDLAKVASCAYAMSFVRTIQAMKTAPLGEKRLERNYMMGLIHMGWENRYMYQLAYELPKLRGINKQNGLRESPFYPGYTIQ